MVDENYVGLKIMASKRITLFVLKHWEMDGTTTENNNKKIGTPNLNKKEKIYGVSTMDKITKMN